MKKGFTLIEMMVVIAIVAVIATISIPLYAKYVSRANKAAVISDTRTAVFSIEAFVGTYKELPNSSACPSSGYGPATCDLSKGSLLLKGAVAVSKDVKIDVSTPSTCTGYNSYKVHGVHKLVQGWGYCFDGCLGKYVETNGSGCP